MFETLVFKLSKYDKWGKALNLIKSYLLKRKMFVRTNGCDLSLQEIKRFGVPQGYVFGSLFLIIYVNDMKNIHRKSLCIRFTDDTKILQRVKYKFIYEIMHSELKELREKF